MSYFPSYQVGESKEDNRADSLTVAFEASRLVRFFCNVSFSIHPISINAKGILTLLEA